MDWLPQDVERAAKEGWKRQNGFVTRIVDASGRSAFTSDMQLMLYLYRQGISSQWHREVFISLPWTGAHDEMAEMQGWCIGRNHGVFTLSAHKGLKGFKTNTDAAEFVSKQAQQGDPLCMKAAVTISKRRLLSGE